MFESVKYTSQYLAIQPNGKPDDPRADGLAGVNARRFYVYCKVSSKPVGVLTNTIVIYKDIRSFIDSRKYSC